MRLLLKLGLVNVALLILYIGLNYFEWRNVLRLPWIADMLWTPLRTTIWTSSTSAFEPAIKDGVLWIDNWSFIILPLTIIINLATVWKVEQGETSTKSSR